MGFLVIQISCTQCNGVFKMGSSQGHAYVQCPYCGTANAVANTAAAKGQPSGRHPVDGSGSSRNVMYVLIAIAGVFAFLMLLLAVGIFAWYSLSPELQVADRQAETGEELVAPDGEAEQQSASPETDANRRNGKSSKPSSTNGKNMSSFRYGFDKGYRYEYSFSVKSNLNKQDVSSGGVVSYTVGEVGGRIDSALKQGVPGEITKMPNLMKVGCIATVSQRTGSDRSTHSTWSGDLLCDDTGQVHKSVFKFGNKDESQLIPYVFSTLQQVGLVDFPDNGVKNWSEEGSIQVVSVSASETQVPQSPVDRILSRHRARFPGGYQPTPPPSLPGFRGAFDPYGRRSTRDTKPIDVEVKTMSLNTVTQYKVKSENAATLILERSITGTPTDDSDIKIKLNRTETLTFDKKKNVLSKIESEGETQLQIDNITLTMPIEYSVNLKVKTPEDLAKEKLERDKRHAKSRAESEARQAKFTAERKAKKEKLAAEKLAAKEHASKYEHASFGDVSWGVKSMAFTPDGKFMICGHLDRKVSVYDTQRKRRVEFQEKLEQLGQVVCIAVSPDGKYVLTGGYSGRIQVWKIDDRGLLDNVGQFVGHSSEIKSISIDPTGKRVLSGESDKVARLWNLKTQKEIQAIREFESGVLGTGFTEGGKIGVATCRNNAIFVEAATGEISRKRKGYRRGSAHDITFSPDGTEFVVADGYDIKVYETDTASKIKTIKGDSINWKLSYFPDGKHVLSGENALCMWSTESASKVFEINVGDHVNVQAIATSPDGRFVAGDSRPLKLFSNPLLGASEFSLKKNDAKDKASGSGSAAPSKSPEDLFGKSDSDLADSNENSLPAIHCQFSEQGWGVDALCFSPDGRYLYAGKYGLKVYDVIKKRTIDNHARFKAGSVTAIKASANGKHVLTALGSGEILVWKTDKRGQLEQVGKFTGHSSAVKAISIGPNSRWVVSGEKKRARIWDLETQKESLAVDFGKQVTSCAVLPNGKAAVMSDGKGITVVMIPEMTVWKKFDKIGNGSGSHSAVSKDGRKLAVANGYEIEVFDSTTGGSIASKMKAGETVWTLAFHPDGKHLLAGGRGKVMIWDTEKQTKVAELDVPTSYIQCLAISDDGKRIAAIPGSAGQNLTVFNSPVE